jgi:large subunit ribosomal protein L32e
MKEWKEPRKSMSDEELEKPATQKALALRERHKGKKPFFRREESWRYKRVSQVWRKPDGTESKMRKKKKGWPKSVEIGYRGPRIARELHPSGYIEVLVNTVDDLDKVDPKTQAIRIAHAVGMRKRADISLRAEEKSIHILNPLPKPKPEEEEAIEEAAEEAEAEAKPTETEAEAEEKTEEAAAEQGEKEEEKES